MPEQYNMHEAKTHLSKLVEQALAGKEVIIAKAGKPVVTLTPTPEAPRKKKRVLGQLRGKIFIPDNFDDEDPEILKMFGVDP